MAVCKNHSQPPPPFEISNAYQQLQKFLNGQSMFSGGTVTPQGAIVPQRQCKLPKWIKWASLLSDMQRVIDEKLAKGCDICYTDGSKLDTGGVAHDGFGLWYGPEDKRNKRLPVPSAEKQSIGRAELYGVLTAVENKTAGVPLHVVTDSETVYAGLMGKCAKWERHGWVGSRGYLSYACLLLLNRLCLCARYFCLGNPKH